MKPIILIVDDSLTVRMDLEEIFSAAGFSPVLCADLTSARQALKENECNLVILDLLLPDGNGVDLLREIRNNPAQASIPVILLSRETEVRQRLQGLGTGADEYIGKPYDPIFVVARARQLIGPLADEEKDSQTKPLVLVIDDSTTFREELKELFENEGYQVLTAASGEEGVRLAVQFRPNAVVVDGVLPGIDGATTIRRLRSEVSVATIPCLFLTGSSHAASELAALEAGADSFLSKDAGKDLILARLGAMLRNTTGGITGRAPQVISRRILAVDDSPTFLHELSSALQKDQFEVILARSGEEALQLLAVQKVDCILLDLVMPGLSGEETCRLIKSREETKDIPVMVLTARKDEEVVISCLQAGADDFVPKSADFDILKARLRAQIRRKQFQEETRRIRQVAVELIKNETMLQALFESAPDAVLVIDQQGRIVRANGQAVSMFGYPLPELLEQKISLLIPEHFHSWGQQHNLLATDPRVHDLSLVNELWGKHKDGQSIPVDIKLGPVQTDEGLLVLATIRDITYRKQAEALLHSKDEEVRETSRQLWQAAKLATMGELAASIAHELNNPLASISLRVEGLLEDQVPNSPAHRDLLVIEQEVDRMASLVGNLLQFSRVGTNQISTVDVLVEIDSTLELVKHHLRKNGVEIVREYLANLPCIYADRLKLRQLFLNLIVNASDAMSQGGTLTIRAEVEKPDDQPEKMVLFFRDTGGGISPEHMARVMEPFFTTKPEGKGTGLGLPMCRRVVQEHHGKIELQSEAGKGTLVRVELPLTNGTNRTSLEED